MSGADFVVIAIITVIIALASAKLIADRKAAKKFGTPPVCIGCPIAANCDRQDCSMPEHREPQGNCGKSCGCS